VTARRSAAVIVVVWTALSSPTFAAELTPETIAAWKRYIAETEARQPPRRAARPDGVMIDVPGGTIHHWRGSTVARGVTVDHVVRALMQPGTPPPQEDVRESRVLARTGDTLRVYLKLERRAIVTVVYDTEHLVTFSRHSPRLATSRSIATRIAETGGGDRDFLWRLNSYWRYTQEGDNVRIEVESISLSRDVPRLVRPVAGPIVTRVARESLVRTLESVRTFVEVGRR
jgi:hypothetical protein